MATRKKAAPKKDKKVETITREDVGNLEDVLGDDPDSVDEPVAAESVPDVVEPPVVQEANEADELNLEEFEGWWKRVGSTFLRHGKSNNRIYASACRAAGINAGEIRNIIAGKDSVEVNCQAIFDSAK